MTSNAPADTKDRGTSIGLAIGVTCGLVLFSVASSQVSEFKSDAVGLGLNTVLGIAPAVDGNMVRGGPAALTTLAKSAAAFTKSSHPVAFWLGASQLHGLNDPKPGDTIAVAYAQRAATKRGAPLRYVQLSSPNATYFDFLAFYLGFRQLGAVPNTLIVAVTYDDFREEALRHGENKAVLKAIDFDALVATGGDGVTELKAQVDALGQTDSNAPMKRSATALTPQDALEKWIVAQLEVI